MAISTAFRDTYDLAFQVSPIILQGGIVAGSLGGMMPIIGITGQLAAFGINAAAAGFSSEDFYARFVPLPGATVINNAIGTYPFANQNVAANAIISEPLNISMMMIIPINTASGYISKLAIFTALRTSLDAHNQAGGTYHVATPSFIYTNCIMTGMTDITGGDTKQHQVHWQIDFVKPLVTQNDAQQAYSGLMQKLVGGNQVTSPSWSGASAAINSAVQGATQGINNMSGPINKFLASPL